MKRTVVVDFEKVDGTTGELTFEDVDEVNEVQSPGVGCNLIFYREGETNGTIDNIDDYSLS